MSNYIDGFILPIPKQHLEEYRNAAEAVAEIWLEHGALAYHEFVGDDMHLEGVRSFKDVVQSSGEEVIIFGWVEFSSREARDLANERLAADARVNELIAPLTSGPKIVFDAGRMAYAGFKPLIQLRDNKTEE
jgi:uncharacterized protein YbaA (DUF1428 family)